MRDIRGGHSSGRPYGQLPMVSSRPAVGAPSGPEKVHGDRHSEVEQGTTKQGKTE